MKVVFVTLGKLIKPVVLIDGEIRIKKNCIGSLKDEGLVCSFGHSLQIVDKLPGILVNSVVLTSREVEG